MWVFGAVNVAVVTEFIEGLVETFPGLQYLDGFPQVVIIFFYPPFFCLNYCSVSCVLIWSFELWVVFVG